MSERTQCEEIASQVMKVERKIRHLLRKRSEVEAELSRAKDGREKLLESYDSALAEERAEAERVEP